MVVIGDNVAVTEEVLLTYVTEWLLWVTVECC